MTYEDIEYALEDGVATIWLNRPDKLNAARVSTHDELISALDRADCDDAVKAIIVSGRGRAFCAGTDLSDGFALPSGGDPATGEGVQADVGGRVTLRLYDMRKPVIGAVNGAAVGFGATFLLPMDFRLAAVGAKFGFVFTRRGIVAESCSSWFLPRVVGLPTALDWMLTGRMVAAEEALAKGLVTELLAPDALMARVRAIARDIVENCAPVSVAMNRQLLWKLLGADHPRAAHHLESRGLAAALAHADSAEGAKSFVEKRAPAFTGNVSDAGFIRAWWQD